MSYKTGFYKGRLGIGLSNTMGMGDGNPRFPLDINGDIRLTGDIMNENGISLLGSTNGIFVLTDNNDIVLGNESYNVGIGTTSPGAKLDITKNGPTSTTDPNATEMLWFKSPFTSGIKEEGGFKFITDDTFAGTGIYPRLTLYAYQGTGSVWQPQAITFKTTSSTNVNVGIGTTDPIGKLQITGNGTGDIWTTATTAGDCHMLIGGNEWGSTGTNETLKIGLGYLESATGNVPMYIGCRIITSSHDTTSALVFGTRNSEYDTTVAEERMCILPDGNVGIGTTSPGAKLEVNGTSIGHTNNTPTKPSCLIYGDHSGEVLWIGHPNQTQGIQLGYNTIKKWSTNNGATNDSLHFNISGSTDMTIDSTGEVGIGTTSPYSKLEITAGADTSHIRISEGSHNNSSSTFLYPALTYYARQDNIRRNYDPFNQRYGASASISFTDRPGTYTYVNAVRSSDIVFHTATSYVSPNLGHYPIERMRITAEGNVGIGTTSPDAKLEVSGDLNLEATNDNWNTSVGKGLYLRFYGGTVNTGYIQSINRSNSDELFPLQFTASTFRFNSTSGTTYIDTNGNVGIGTTSPQTMLDIQGVIDGNCLTLRNGNNNNEYDQSQILLSYMGNPYNSGGYSHKIQSRHNSGTPHHDNAIDFYLWKNGQGAGAIGNTHGMSITAGGVGIGTTSPTTILQIKGNGDSNNVQLLIENESYDKGIQFQYKSASGSSYNFPQAKIWTSGSSYDTKLHFSTAKGSSNSNTVLSTAMTIDYDGNVGIGTDAPGNKLRVNGQIGVSDANDSLNSWKITMGGGLGIHLGTGEFTTPGSLGTYYRCEFPGNAFKWTTLWVGRGTHDDSDWRGAFAFKIMYHGAGYGHFNSGEWRVLGYDNDTRTWIAKVGDSYTQTRLYLWLQGGSTYKWAGDGIYHYTISSSDTVTSGTMPSEWDASVSTSDDRIKHNEKKIDGLKVINKLNPMRYFKTNKPYSENFHFDLDNSGNPITDEPYTIETGLIAQEVRKIPELEHLVYGEDWYDLDKELEEMRENGEDIPEMDLSGNHIDMSDNKIPRKLQLRYKDIFVYNIAATQELYKENQELKTEVATLKSELATIKEYLGL